MYTRIYLTKKHIISDLLLSEVDFMVSYSDLFKFNTVVNSVQTHNIYNIGYISLRIYCVRLSAIIHVLYTEIIKGIGLDAVTCD